MFNGKMKALTFSYDDAVTQDVRLIEILNKYNLKATFNLNSERLGQDGYLEREGKRINHIKVNPSDVKSIYKDHEVAVHTLTHPLLTHLEDDEVIRQVEQDRLNLSTLVGYEVKGMAYPCGYDNDDERVAKLIKENTGVKYARTTDLNDSFDRQDDLIRFNPTAYHLNFEKNYELAEKFFSMNAEKEQIFYIWGHSYEFDINNTWNEFEKFCEFVSGREDVCYATNSEILLND